jgi:hypothetical protein
MLGERSSWVLHVGAWASGLVFELEMWRLEDMVVGVVVVAVVGRSWDLVARTVVGVVLGVLDLVGLVESLSTSVGDIFLRRRCLRASGWPLAAMWLLRLVCACGWYVGRHC